MFGFVRFAICKRIQGAIMIKLKELLNEVIFLIIMVPADFSLVALLEYKKLFCLRVL